MFRNNLILYANVCTIYKLVLALELRGGGYNPRMYHTYKGGSMVNNNKHQGIRASLLLPLSCVLGLGIACALSQPTTALAQNPGWIHKDNAWTYVKDDGNLATGWLYTPSGKWFYFNKDNYQMVTGKLTDDHKDYWLDENAGLLYDRWVQDAKGNWLHTDDNGVLATGWFKTKSGYWFYFNQDHTMKTGILTDKGYTFWLDKNDGLLYNEWVKDESGKWLHTDGNGCLVKGWYHAPNGKWFYFNKDTYKMVTGKLTDDNKDYWLDENAGLLYDRWVQDAKGNWLHTDDNGVLATGWFKTKSGYWFYFNQDHTMKTGILTDKGYTFWLDKNDGLLYNEWVKDSKGNWLRTDGNGCLLTGWYHAPNGKWFYFNDDYTMKVGELKENGKIYTFDVDQGWVKTKTWVPEKGHWENTTERVWVPNVVEEPVYETKELFYIIGSRIEKVDENGYPIESSCTGEKLSEEDYGSKQAVLDEHKRRSYNELKNRLGKHKYTVGELAWLNYTLGTETKRIQVGTKQVDRGHYEDKVTGRKWVVDEAGHYE